MAKQTILTERDTGEVMYPQTLASLVQTADGGNVDKGLETAKLALFVDMFNLAAGEYGQARITNGVFDCELNGVTGITLFEAIDIMHRYRYIYTTRDQLPANSQGQRALLPIFGLLNNPVNIGECFQNLAVKQLVFRCATGTRFFEISNAYRAFRQSQNLEVIHGGFVLASSCNVEGMFGDCVALREVRIQHLTTNISFSGCPLLSLDTLNYLASYAANTSVITITVHPEVYAKLTDEGNAEWNQVLISAAAKNITFATT